RRLLQRAVELLQRRCHQPFHHGSGSGEVAGQFPRAESGWGGGGGAVAGAGGDRREEDRLRAGSVGGQLSRAAHGIAQRGGRGVSQRGGVVPGSAAWDRGTGEFGEHESEQSGESGGGGVSGGGDAAGR